MGCSHVHGLVFLYRSSVGGIQWGESYTKKEQACASLSSGCFALFCSSHRPGGLCLRSCNNHNKTVSECSALSAALGWSECVPRPWVDAATVKPCLRTLPDVTWATGTEAGFESRCPASRCAPTSQKWKGHLGVYVEGTRGLKLPSTFHCSYPRGQAGGQNLSPHT